jgi:hypothetical protein
VGPLTAAAGGPSTGSTTSPPASETHAITAKTRPGEPTERSTPASAGAATRLTLSIQPETTLVAVSSSGVQASAGTSAACVGRVRVTAVAATAASAYDKAAGAPASSEAAVAPSAAACTT